MSESVENPVDTTVDRCPRCAKTWPTTRAQILEETLARLEVERLSPPPTPHPTVAQARAQRLADLERTA